MTGLLLAFAASFVAGYLGSAVGLVLGTLRLPAMLVAAGDASAAAGTNIAISAATSSGLASWSSGFARRNTPRPPPAVSSVGSAG